MWGCGRDDEIYIREALYEEVLPLRNRPKFACWHHSF